jgi:SPASM domain peptide maturase of grasp-with-spasm system
MIDEYFRFLLEKKLGHFISFKEFSMFPKIGFEYNYPGTFSNCIVEVSTESNPCLINNVIRELSLELNVLNYLIHIHSYNSLNDLLAIINVFKTLRYNSLEVVFNLLKKEDYRKLDELTDSGIISKLSVHNSKNNIQIHGTNYYESEFTGSSCAKIHISRMIVNMEYYAESISYNTCLHRKISIDTHGNIKNCPSSTKSFGNIKDTTIEQALNHPDFKKHWNITKDQIDVCKDCEFRHMCTDCRVFIKDPENIFSQPAKCTYNPYIAKWQGEDGYVPVEECGTYTRETGFLVNHKRVEELNKQLWGE